MLERLMDRGVRDATQAVSRRNGVRTPADLPTLRHPPFVYVGGGSVSRFIWFSGAARNRPTLNTLTVSPREIIKLAHTPLVYVSETLPRVDRLVSYLASEAEPCSLSSSARMANAVAVSDMNKRRHGSPFSPPCSRS